MNKAVKEILSIFETKGSDIIRYRDIEKIDDHQEGLHELENSSQVTTYHKNGNLYIMKNF